MTLVQLLDRAALRHPEAPTVNKEIPKTASGKILRRLLREGHYLEVHA